MESVGPRQWLRNSSDFLQPIRTNQDGKLVKLYTLHRIVCVLGQFMATHQPVSAEDSCGSVVSGSCGRFGSSGMVSHSNEIKREMNNMDELQLLDASSCRSRIPPPIHLAIHRFYIKAGCICTHMYTVAIVIRASKRSSKKELRPVKDEDEQEKEPPRLRVPEHFGDSKTKHLCGGRR
eukprot:GHVU01109550.1.p1 GENE.GHVU01109550.1~~GHVU01109550.1.p1  ORF type:complete len:178 (-),score=5.38 GHVU01109550.1:494-1027(-)